MFWRFGGYANISTLDSILDKPDFTLEEILDDTDLIQELKQHNTKLIEYLRDEAILRRLFEYVVAPPIDVPDEEDDEENDTEAEGGDGKRDEGQEKAESPEQQQQPARTFGGMRSLSLTRNKSSSMAAGQRQEEREELDKREKNRLKYAFAAAEILSSEIWSIMEAMLDAREPLSIFWSFLEREAPLDPVTAGYFSKIVDPLLDKKTADMLTFIKTYGNFVPLILKHIDTPNIMDVLLKIISVDKQEGGAGIIEWLHDQDLMPSLLSFVGPSYPTSTQIAAGDFIKAIVTISANASQNEQQCIGPNSLTRQLVSERCVNSLIKDMLEGGNPLTVGVGIVIEVIRKNNSDYDPEVGGGPESPPSSSDPIYLGTLLRLFADNVPNFTALLTDAKYTLAAHESSGGKQGRALKAAFGKTIEPLGFDRFKTCELMAELLHCSNMGLLNERGSETFVNTKDQERERLRSEGKLARVRSGTEEVEDGQSQDQQHPADSSSIEVLQPPDQSRKLEVTNSVDDDGFEELGTSSELEEQNEKDQFAYEEEPPSDLQASRSSQSRLSLDDEFFDEPLNSPKLEPTPDSAIAGQNTAEAPATAATTTQEAGKAAGTAEAAAGAERTTSEQLVDAIESHLGPGSMETDPPALPERQSHLNPPASQSANEDRSRDMSPHPEDKPAPLFSGKSSTGASQKDGSPELSEKAGVSGADASDAMAQDPQEDLQAAADQPTQAEPVVSPEQLEQDIDGRPLVGDHLKMMFVEHKVIPTILDFFFRFPWNNFLHNVVYDVVQQVFNGPMDRGYNRFLAIDLFDNGKITDRIIQGQLHSDEAQHTRHMRLGYMGHLTLIAEEVVKFSERHPPEVLSELVVETTSTKIWTDYVDNTLAETRDRDNAILGGVRPDVGGPRQAVLNAVNSGGFSSGSSGLTAGLGGGNELGNGGGGGGGGGVGAGFVSGGSLLSGFGSSSDEEDEDMEEIGEPEESGARSDQYPAYRPSSLSALSIFSSSQKDDTSSNSNDPDAANAESGGGSSDGTTIPPPLNIPPSRARRQLAARLARHNNPATNTAEADSSGGLSIGESGGGGVGSNEAAATSLSAAFNSLQLAGGHEGQDEGADPWARVGKPSSASAEDEGSRWIDAARKKGRNEVGGNSSDEEEEEDSDEEGLGGGEKVPIQLSLGRHGGREEEDPHGSELGMESEGSSEGES